MNTKDSVAEKSYKEYLTRITAFIFDIDGVLTDGTVLVNTDGQLLRRMNIKDGYALKTAVDRGFHICIISGGTNEGARIRLENLGIKDIFLGVSQKTKILNRYAAEKNIDLKNAVFMGDDLPDYRVMKMVGLPVCPQDAVPEIKAISKYISHKKGGKGCVRDIIEQVLKVQKKWMPEEEAPAQYD